MSFLVKNIYLILKLLWGEKFDKRKFNINLKFFTTDIIWHCKIVPLSAYVPYWDVNLRKSKLIY